MGTAYAKIFESLFDGSLRGKPDEILVFVNMLTHTSAFGRCDIHFRKISDETGIPIDRVRSAVTLLESPDPESRSPDEQGCRIKRLDDHRDWGWRIINHQKYRMMGGQDDNTKELTRLRVAKFRERNKVGVALGNVTKTLPPASASVHGSVPEGGVGGGVSLAVCFEWLATAKKSGADYTEHEVRKAWLDFQANGWMWGKNPVVDYRSALESRIQDNRNRANGQNHQPRKRRDPTL